MTALRPLGAIVHDIVRDMSDQSSKMKSPVKPSQRFYAAWPYLTALSCMNDVTENYGCDSGVSVVLYCLSNLSTYRGPTAKALKDELKSHLPERYRGRK